jgi:transcriptional regulator with XRE-family HTH domain
MLEGVMSRPVHTDRRLLRSVGARIRKARVARGVTQSQLAERIGVEPETVSRYERGLIPLSLSQLHQVAVALDIGAEALIGVSGKRGREADLLERFRLLDKGGQELVLGLLRRLAP